MNLDKANNYFKSHSKEQSALQAAYNELFIELCKEYGVDHPFQLDDNDVTEFFHRISARWKEKKANM